MFGVGVELGQIEASDMVVEAQSERPQEERVLKI